MLEDSGELLPMGADASGHGRRPNNVTPSVVYRAILLAFGLVAVTLLFPVLVGLLLLGLLVALVAVPLSVATTHLQRLGVPRFVGAPLVLLLALAALGGLIALLVPTFVAEGNHLINALPGIVDDLRHDIANVTNRSPSKIGRDVQDFVNGYRRHPGRLLGPATAVGSTLAALIAALIVILLTALYSAIQPAPLIDGAVRLVPLQHRARARHLIESLRIAYLGWLRGLVVGMAVLGVITYGGLRLVGMPYALVFATVTALAMVVPYFGALFSMLPPVALALTMSPGKAALVAALYLIAHQIEGNLIEPLIMARAVKLHPALVAFGVIVVERLLGFLGLIVAVPVIVTFKLLVEEAWVRPLEERRITARRTEAKASSTSVSPARRPPTLPPPG